MSLRSPRRSIEDLNDTDGEMGINYSDVPHDTEKKECEANAYA